MRLEFEEKPNYPPREARSGKLAAALIVLVITALFVALLRYVAGL